ncbi:MAG: hypothetical protein JJU11_11535 [Candidatus Sumerlaeia bacterium]|nr:hypothetical protein [Candidatus Sumerlaeia bacterium]
MNCSSGKNPPGWLRATLAVLALSGLTVTSNAQVAEYFVASGQPIDPDTSFEVGVSMSGNTVGPLDAYGFLVTYDLTEIDSISVSTPDIGSGSFIFDLISLGPPTVSGNTVTRRVSGLYSGSEGLNPLNGRFSTITFNRTSLISGSPSWSIVPDPILLDGSFLSGDDSLKIPASIVFIPTPDPALPSNPVPENQATAVPFDTTLSWTVTGTGPVEDYEVRIWEPGDARPVAPTAIVTSPAYSPTLDTDTRYRWDVVARAGSSTTAGPTWNMRTALNETPAVISYFITGDPNTPNSPVTLTAQLEDNTLDVGGFALSIAFNPDHLSYIPDTAVISPDNDFSFDLQSITEQTGRLNLTAIASENGTVGEEGVLFRAGFMTTATPGTVDAFGIPANLVVEDHPTVLDTLLATGDDNPGIHKNFQRLASFEAPPTPINPTPADAMTGIPTTLQFSWNVDGPPVYNSEFELYVWEDGDTKPTEPTVTTTETFAQVSDLEPFTDYQWQVTNRAGTLSADSDTWTFTTGVDAGVAVIGYTTIGDPTVVGNTITLRATIEENDFLVGGFSFSLYYDEDLLTPTGTMRAVSGSDFGDFDQSLTTILSDRVNLTGFYIDPAATAMTGDLFEIDLVVNAPLTLDAFNMPSSISLTDNPLTFDNLVTFGDDNDPIPHVFVRRETELAPTLIFVGMQTSNPNPPLAIPGDTITLNMASNIDMTTPNVTIAGRTATVSGSGSSYTASIVVTNDEPSGNVALSISGYESLTGAPGPTVTSTTNDSFVYIDKSRPSVTITMPVEATNQTFIPDVEVQFTIPIFNLTLGDFVGDGITVSNLQGSGFEYTVEVTITGTDGAKTLSLPEGSVNTLAGNTNTASNVASVIYDTTAPTSSIAADFPSRVESPITGTFSADDGAGSGVDTVSLWIKTPDDSWTSGTVVSGGVWSYIPTAGTGVYEFTTIATDLAGNTEATPEPGDPGEISVLWNAVENGPFTIDTVEAGTFSFPMTNDIVINLTFDAGSTGGPITVSRALGNVAPVGIIADRLIDEHLNIDGNFTGSATLTWPYDPDNAAGLDGSIESVFQFDGNDLLNQFPVTVFSNVITVVGITSFSEWFAGSNNADVMDWMELVD